MRAVFKKIDQLLPLIIVGCAAVLIFSSMMRADIQHDDATYSFRSLTYLDYLNTVDRQTTPLLWFGAVPWWGVLSFHDHPPLVFLIQHLFFILFGASTFVARLPFALAGVTSVYLTILVGRKLYSRPVGLLAGGLLAILSYHTWASSIGYLESIGLFLMLLALHLFLIAVEHKKFFWAFGVALGATLLTKYTMVFIVPALLLYVLVKKRQLFADWRFIGSLVLAALIFSPVLFYNFQMLQARGHFDLQLSLLLHQDFSQDWPGITRDSGGLHFLTIGKVLSKTLSLPMLLLVIGAVVYLLVEYIRAFKEQRHLLLMSMLFFATLLFGFIGAQARFLLVVTPFLMMGVSTASWSVFEDVRHRFTMRSGYTIGVVVILAVFVFCELFYNINTNLLREPIGQPLRHYSSYRWPTGSFNQLEQFLFAERFGDIGYPKHIRTRADYRIDLSEYGGRDIFIYDPELNWFSTLWYFDRLSVFYGIPFIAAAGFATILPPDEWVAYFSETKFDQVTLIVGESDTVLTSTHNREEINLLVKDFISAGAHVKEINSGSGKHSFTLYTLSF